MGVPLVIERLFEFLEQQRHVFQEYKLSGNERRCTLTLTFCHEDHLLQAKQDTTVPYYPLPLPSTSYMGALGDVSGIPETSLVSAASAPPLSSMEELLRLHQAKFGGSMWGEGEGCGAGDPHLGVNTNTTTEQDPESDSGLQMSPNPVMRVSKYYRKKGDKEVLSSESENGSRHFKFPPVPPNFTPKQKDTQSEDTDASDNTDCDSDARSDDSFDVVSVVDPDEPSDEKLASEAISELETSLSCTAIYLKTQIAGLNAKARENIMDQTRNTKILRRAYHFDGATNTLTGISEDVMIRLNIDSRDDSALGTLRKWALRETSNKAGWQDWFEAELTERRYTVPADEDRYPTASRKMEHILMNLLTKLRDELR